MTRQWRKLGQLYVPQIGLHPKLYSHAANPLAVKIENDIYRIYYSGRDLHNRSSVGAVDIDIVKRQVISEYNSPFFTHGGKGSFYEAGVSIGCQYSVGNQNYILFMGWQTPTNEHWRGDIGRLVINPDFSLRLDSSEAFIKTSFDEIDPLSLSYPWVLKREHEKYQMWYGSTQTWDAGNGEMIHVINCASSSDGNGWSRDGLAVPYQIGLAQAFSRPTVSLAHDGNLEMWFSYRSGIGEKYRIGYARMIDQKWKLALQETGIDVSSSGWDSEMICYPYVFDHKDERYMLYNGNGYGQTGFGIAVLKENNK